MSVETQESIRRDGIAVWLKAELPLLLRRVLKRNNRPLLADDPEGAMRRLMEARYPTYAKADVTVESHDLPHEAIVAEVVRALAANAVLGQPASMAASAGEPS